MIIIIIIIIITRCRAAKCCQYTCPTTTFGALGWYKTAQQQGNGCCTSRKLLGLYSVSQFYLRLRGPEVESRLHEQKMSSLAEPLSRPLCVVKSHIRLEVTLFYAEHNGSRGALTSKKRPIPLGSSSSSGSHQQTNGAALRTSWPRR